MKDVDQNGNLIQTSKSFKDDTEGKKFMDELRKRSINWNTPSEGNVSGYYKESKD